MSSLSNLPGPHGSRRAEDGALHHEERKFRCIDTSRHTHILILRSPPLGGRLEGWAANAVIDKPLQVIS